MAGHPRAFALFRSKRIHVHQLFQPLHRAGSLCTRRGPGHTRLHAVCRAARNRPGDPGPYTNCIQTLRWQHRVSAPHLASDPHPTPSDPPAPTSAALAGICAEDEVVPWPALLAPSSDPRAAAGGHFPLSPPASLDQKPLLLDPGLSPPDLAASAACCLHLLEGWGPASPSAQTVLQALCMKCLLVQRVSEQGLRPPSHSC